MSSQILRLPTVQERTGLPRSSIYAKVAKGKFPKPVQLNGRAVGWLADEIADWISNQVVQSRAASEGSPDA